MHHEVDVNCIIAPTIELPRREVSQAGKLPHWGHAPCPPVVFTYARAKDLRCHVHVVRDGIDLEFVVIPHRRELHFVILA